MKSLTFILGVAFLSTVLVGRGIGAEPSSGKTDTEADLFGATAKVLVPEFRNLLADPRADVRLWAAYGVATIGPDAKDAVPALIRLTSDEDPSVRQAAAYALGRMGPGAEKAAQELAAMLREPNGAIRDAAADALTRIGSVAKAAVPEATLLLEDPRWEVRRSAADALGGIGAGPRGHPGAEKVVGRPGTTGPDRGRRRPDHGGSQKG